MAALGWLTPRRRSATARSVLAGEASAEAARKSAQAEAPPHTAPPQDAAVPETAPLDLASAAGGAGRPVRPAEPAEVPEDSPEPEFPVPGDDLAAAFFDLDNTVMQGAAIFHFGRGLYKREFFRRRELARFAWQQAWFRLAGVEDPEHMQDARDSALSIVKGHKVSELMSIGEEIYDEYMAERIWPGTRALAQAHLDAGQKVWLVTAAPVETATIIARRLGLTGALGTVAESVDGIYTGRLVGEPLHGPAKAEAVRALAAAEDLDLERCAAYSDSHNDIPMLSLVGHPYAINPDTKLRKHARANDWRLRDYRTGRKAVKVGVPAAAGVGALAGGAAAAIALHRRRK
ncbi:HAD-IB family hydrolase [Streptomyces sp. NPDC048507]|uniref:HAD family hydrolase n=1 Tax=Streptomyces sp. NPDC048507 TaxID=3365560 RepID=UPI0037231ED7